MCGGGGVRVRCLCVRCVLCLVCLPLRVRPRVCPVLVLRFWGTWYSHLWACEFGAAVEATRRGSVKSTKIESAPTQGSGAELCAATRTG